MKQRDLKTELKEPMREIMSCEISIKAAYGYECALKKYFKSNLTWK